MEPRSRGVMHEYLRAHSFTGRSPPRCSPSPSRWPARVAFRILPVSPLPQVDFPTISVSASLPGASPETMASSVATPLERQFGRIAARHRDDLFQHARLHQHHPAIRSEPQHRCRRARRAGRHHRRPRLPAHQSSQQPDLPQGESGRFAHLHDRPHLRRAEQGPDVRCRVHHHGAETVAGSAASDRWAWAAARFPACASS